MVYEYGCQKHGVFEVSGIPLNDYKKPQQCPKCEEQKIENICNRVIATPPVKSQTWRA